MIDNDVINLSPTLWRKSVKLAEPVSRFMSQVCFSDTFCSQNKAEWEDRFDQLEQ